MNLIVRPLERWPREFTPASRRKSRPFMRSNSTDAWRREAIPWADTVELLERELRFLRVTTAVLQLAIAERDVRHDGWVRADARPSHPGAIVAFEAPGKGPLSYACDAFDHWHDNVRGIAKGLEALRLVQRYGIAASGEQYVGWRAIGSGTPMPAATMTLEAAARFLIEHGEFGGEEASVEDLLDAGPDVIGAYYRAAAKKLHPDAGGDPVAFRRLGDARDLLLAHIAA